MKKGSSLKDIILKKSVEMYLSCFSLEKILGAPGFFYLKMRGGLGANSSRLIRRFHDVYYLEMAKCANSTIINALWGDKKNKMQKKSLNLSNFNESKREAVSRGFVFTFIRNPYSRVLSAYLDKVKHESDESSYIFNGPMGHLSAKDLSFEEFVKMIVVIPDNIIDIHLRSHSSLINDNGIRVDFVGKLENFERDWNRIRHILKLPPSNKLLLKNKNRKGYSLRKYYTPELKDLVYKRYKKDFENFGYKK